MEDEVYNQVYEIIHDMYNDLSKEYVDPKIMNVLMTAAKHLTSKKMPPQVVAAKTVNTLTIVNMDHKIPSGNNNSERLDKLMVLSRADGYKWNSNGVGSLGVTFF